MYRPETCSYIVHSTKVIRLGNNPIIPAFWQASRLYTIKLVFKEIIMTDRTSLPYRRNCEGYFLYENEKVIAQDTGRGYIEFPGGGVDESESPSDAILREALEETGAKIACLSHVETIYFDWGENWAKTEKQKKRYELYRGEEMHLFTGKVDNIEIALGDIKNNDPAWEGNRLMGIKDIIKALNSFKPFPSNMEEYHEKQIYYIRNIKNLLMCDEGA